ncbi:MAG TPA: hypothetical protein RMH85_18390 [Polyangiaceae bacterium LLY-WYZ-15_(1-7)]|nr:hypothetical protein [Myxococcales bacterium]MAT24288.1 hypothetical protein [Sandaracinus sp.]HJK90688.1 hypothetical protein [Polyangiaceae bacterium LLY-WYZ-15_(1-7)]MBJ74536.1 hypothetical protein [Sandaracinus sp.]HJL04257.1 hypothetical protein [Polyangiaceae bacterium LLY-WYZ-15_(1-7)]
MSTIRTVNSPALAPALEEAGLDDEAVAAMAMVTNEELDEFLGPDLSEGVQELLTEDLQELGGLIPQGMALTPTAIIMLLQTRLNSLDGEIEALMGDMDVRQRGSEAIARQTQALRTLRGAMSEVKKEPGKKVKLEDVQVIWDGRQMNGAELLNEVGLSERVAVSEGLAGRLANKRAARDEALRNDNQSKVERLDGEIADIEAQLAERGNARFNGEERVSGNTIDQLIEEIGSEQGQAQSGQELTMIRMQSTMQQRSQAVTLSTQMLKSITDSMQAIARNVV